MSDTAPADDFLTVVRSSAYHEDPYPFLAELRATEAVYRSPTGVWLLSSYGDVVRAIRDRALGTDIHTAGSDGDTVAGGGVPGNLLLQDPPDHTRIRKLVSRGFTPGTVQRLRPEVQALVDGLLDDVDADGDGTMDLIADFAYPLPVAVICKLLGVPAEDHGVFQSWSARLGAGIDPDFLRTDEQRAATDSAGHQFAAYFAELITRRRREPGDDLLSKLIAAQGEGDITEDELIVNGIFLVVSGHESTVNLIGNGMLALLRHPDQLSRLRDDPTLASAAMEELLRYDSPLQLSVRVTRDPYLVGGVTIEPGEQLVTLLGAANRDPTHFNEPDRLDLSRENVRQHVAFGGGSHFCVGAPLARLVSKIAICSLLRRYPRIDLDGPPVHSTAFALRGLLELPVRVR